MKACKPRWIRLEKNSFHTDRLFVKGACRSIQVGEFGVLRLTTNK
jgi:hypothetical protein